MLKSNHMGIISEYNPDLALRNISESKKGNRKVEECVPEKLQTNKIYNFLKKGQRLYWLHGEIPLLETKGEGKLSKPKASIIILEATHFLDKSEIYTKGKYKVIEIFDDDKIHFNGFAKIQS
jgi:hypothetical protein